MKEDVEQWNLFSEEEVNEVCERLIDPKKVSSVPSILLDIVRERVAL